jgi:hypothetical protein
LINGYQIQYQLYLDTKTRMDRLADLYSSYFTARFQGYPARDYSLDYFAGCGNYTPPQSNPTLPCLFDPVAGGSALLSNYTWADVGGTAGALEAALGLGPEEEFSAWYDNNNAPLTSIQVANQQLSGSDIIYNVQPQEPAIKAANGANLPPYTALLRVPLPVPSDKGPLYLLKVVTGTY